MADAERDIYPFLNDIDNPVDHQHLSGDIGVSVKIGRDNGHDMQAAKF